MDVCLQPGFLNPQMVAQRNREMMTISQMRRQQMMMLMHQQGQGAAGGFNPPPNVTAPVGMDGPVGGPAINQTGQQGFNYGANYGELPVSLIFIHFRIFISYFVFLLSVDFLFLLYLQE